MEPNFKNDNDKNALFCNGSFIFSVKYMHIVHQNYKALIQPTMPKPPVPKIAKKRALLVGSNYPGTPNQLQGCLNDVAHVSGVLTSKGYTCALVTDFTALKPTRNNILMSLQSLLRTSSSGDTCFFLFSGHGTNTRDRNGDEVDGKDEMICPCDMRMISDDELNTMIKTNLKPGVTLIALFDSCFSGSVLDLKYSYFPVAVNSRVKDTPSTVVMISGCRDNQTSADANINSKWQGAMTASFLNSISSPNIASLLTNMRTYLAANKYTQVPQLSSGRPLNSNILYI
jgi:hypothetical protein